MDSKGTGCAGVGIFVCMMLGDWLICGSNWPVWQAKAQPIHNRLRATSHSSRQSSNTKMQCHPNLATESDGPVYQMNDRTIQDRAQASVARSRLAHNKQD